MQVEVSPTTAILLSLDGLLLKSITFDDICAHDKAASMWMVNDLPIFLESGVDAKDLLYNFFDKMSSDNISIFIHTYDHIFKKTDFICSLLYVYHKHSGLQTLINYLIDKELETNEISESSFMTYILSSTNLKAYHKDFCDNFLLKRIVNFIRNNAINSKDVIAKVNNINVNSVTIGSYTIESYMVKLSKCIKNLLYKNFDFSEIQNLFNLKRVYEGEYEIYYNPETFDLEIRNITNPDIFWPLTYLLPQRDVNNFISTNLIF
jgi:hypothetical protein